MPDVFYRLSWFGQEVLIADSGIRAGGAGGSALGGLRSRDGAAGAKCRLTGRDEMGRFVDSAEAIAAKPALEFTLHAVGRPRKGTKK